MKDISGEFPVRLVLHKRDQRQIRRFFIGMEGKEGIAAFLEKREADFLYETISSK